MYQLRLISPACVSLYPISEPAAATSTGAAEPAATSNVAAEAAATSTGAAEAAPEAPPSRPTPQPVSAGVGCTAARGLTTDTRVCMVCKEVEGTGESGLWLQCPQCKRWAHRGCVDVVDGILFCGRCPRDQVTAVRASAVSRDDAVSSLVVGVQESGAQAPVCTPVRGRKAVVTTEVGTGMTPQDTWEKLFRLPHLAAAKKKRKRSGLQTARHLTDSPVVAARRAAAGIPEPEDDDTLPPTPVQDKKKRKKKPVPATAAQPVEDNDTELPRTPVQDKRKRKKKQVPATAAQPVEDDEDELLSVLPTKKGRQRKPVTNRAVGRVAEEPQSEAAAPDTDTGRPTEEGPPRITETQAQPKRASKRQQQAQQRRAVAVPPSSPVASAVLCMYCAEPRRGTRGWIQCVCCNHWAHTGCAEPDGDMFACESCMRDVRIAHSRRPRNVV
eukprot:GHVU01133936.1.p1 GENE.GHVU01133936.1~~GHVU01133936.1.p1  ORF type:complete len:442 (+),score=45.09 GHVU01133936.1:2596-3921(+)